MTIKLIMTIIALLLSGFSLGFSVSNLLDLLDQKTHRSSNEVITSQKAEIERLKKGIAVDLEGYASEYDRKIKAEAIKEFAERLKQKARFCLLDFNKITDTNEGVQAIDNLVKEMVGDSK